MRLWALAPTLDARAEADGATPRLLATLTDHQAAVNAVRFSPSGRQLATGSDDGLGCLYEQRAGPGTSTLGGEAALENWKAAHLLRGHANNVTDVCWAPDDRWLASASLDNSVGVWCAATGGRARTLAGHASYVKGVAWDPVGRYLASQADDESVVVWRTDDWSPAVRVTAPFAAGAAVSSTFALRLAWLPDGSAIVACNACDPKAGVHFAPLIQRETWTSEYKLVGHAGAVVAARPNPHLFKGAAGEPARVVALGSQDNKVSVWRTDSPKALAVGANFFRASVTDLAWTPDGYALLAASTDGTVAVFQFDKAELGAAMSEAEARAQMSRTYGDAATRTADFA